MTYVLLVEDDVWLAELQADVLRRDGFEVTIVPHGYDAIAAIDATVPDVIILDVLLAGATAFSLLNELKSYNDTVAVPIVLCTNLAEQLNLSELSMYGVVRILDKATMHPGDISVAVRAALHRAEGEGA